MYACENGECSCSRFLPSSLHCQFMISHELYLTLTRKTTIHSATSPLQLPLVRCRSLFISSRSSSSTQRQKYTVLGLESSADDTCAAVVSCSRSSESNGWTKPIILSNVVLKQSHVHETFGGLVPRSCERLYHFSLS